MDYISLQGFIIGALCFLSLYIFSSGYFYEARFLSLILFSILFTALLFMILLRFIYKLNQKIQNLNNIHYDQIQPKITYFFGKNKKCNTKELAISDSFENFTS